jgi:hypothetical protein
MKQATTQDFIKPEFRGEDPKDYEIRGDGDCVRKDRWEMAVRIIASKAGMDARSDWEISDIVEAVQEMTGWHDIVKQCEEILKCEDSAESPLHSNLPNLVRDLRLSKTV